MSDDALLVFVERRRSESVTSRYLWELLDGNGRAVGDGLANFGWAFTERAAFRHARRRRAALRREIAERKRAADDDEMLRTLAAQMEAIKARKRAKAASGGAPS